jgi:hypothetical protein
MELPAYRAVRLAVISTMMCLVAGCPTLLAAPHPAAG